MGKIQIDEILFISLVKYHCLGVRDDDHMNEVIARSLEEKLAKISARAEYTQNLRKESQT